MSGPAYQTHDHQGCINDALSTASQLCSEQGVKLTPVRKRVLELVWQSHKPMGAYDLLPTLAEEGFNSAPPTVYRALDFLLELGLVHRLASLNAFIGCSQPGHHHQSCFLLCSECGIAQELNADTLFDKLNQTAAEQGFVVQQQLTEVVGLCPVCADKAANESDASGSGQ